MEELKLSQDQHDVLEAVVAWFEQVGGAVWACDDESCCGYPHVHSEATSAPPVFSIGGLAGTGKTTIIRLLRERLGAQVQFGTPTHKAARVLRGKLPDDQAAQVATYHSLIYRMSAVYRCAGTGKKLKPYKDGCDHGKTAECDCEMVFPSCSPQNGAHTCNVEESLTKELKKFLAGDGMVLVIDEASMLGKPEVEDLRRFNVPILLVGDHGQLPPVKGQMNPWIASPSVRLTKNHRQGEASGIVGAALSVRERGSQGLPYGTYGDGSMVVMSRDDTWAASFTNPAWWVGKGKDAPPFICYRNKTRGAINRRFHGDGPVRVGDKVTSMERCLAIEVDAITGGKATLGQNVISVHNGDVGTVVLVVPASRRDCVNLVVRLDDGRNAMFTDVFSAQFGMDAKVPWDRRPGGVRLMDYAYAFTCHKAQGSEWDGVIVIDESPRDYERWMYTALTRAKNKLVVIRT